MKTSIFRTAAIVLIATCSLSVYSQVAIESPNKKLSATLESENGAPVLKISYDGQPVLNKVDLGVKVNGAEYNTGMTLNEATQPEAIVETYAMVHGKKSTVSNRGNQVSANFVNANGGKLGIDLRAYDDGICFRYRITNPEKTQLKFDEEYTAYNIPSADNRWLQEFIPSYEGDFPLQSGSLRQSSWNYPLLFETQNCWYLITESDSNRDYCNTHVSNENNRDIYKISMPFAWEGNNTGNTNPVSSAEKWESPWRVIIVGSLGDIVESTLVQDVSKPAVITDCSWIKPGSAAWVYWAYNHGTKDFRRCCEYVDLAKKMGWDYVLFDWEWDVMSNGGTIEDATAYAVAQGVKPLMWYNSGGSHTTVGSTPRDRMLTHDSRIKEFRWLKSIGVVGVKIDFFESDKQNIVNYYLDILEDAAAEQMLVNFHGCTLPRGWERTYPNLMSYEGVYGAEQYNNTSNMTAIASRLNCTLPFTRNVVGPMDYTPVAFSNSQNPHNTSFAHELALSVAFESGIQHWADKPEGFALIDGEALRHMQSVPTAWDETRFVDGYPGESFIVARRKGTMWYVAGLNGKSESAVLSADLKFLGNGDYHAIVLTDGKSNKKIATDYRTVTASDILDIETLSQGGFLIKIYQNNSEALKELRSEAQRALEIAKANTGEGKGQYSQSYVDNLEKALHESDNINETSTPEQIDNAYTQLFDAYSALMSYGENLDRTPAGMENAQNITAKYLVEARNFSRSDKAEGASTRFGLLAEPWITTVGIINQDNYTHGGYDSFDNSNSISVEKWDAGGAAIINGKIYQTTSKKLAPGQYRIKFNLYSQFGFAEGENILAVASGDNLPDKENLDNALSTYDISNTGYNGEYKVCDFQITAEQYVTIGWIVNMAQEISGRSMRVNDIRLLCDDEDVSEKYLGNFTNIQRKDVSPARFGSPLNWIVENFNVDNGQNGVKLGIDKYSGDNDLYLGVWDDSKKAVGDLSKTNLYRKISLPAGKYFFGATYHSTWNIMNSYLYVGNEPLTADITKEKALGYYFIPGTSGDSSFKGVTFELAAPQTVFLGWNADLSKSDQQEIRIQEICLLRYLDESGEWIDEMAFHHNDVVNANAFADAGGAKNTFSMDNKPLLMASDGNMMCIGQVNLADIEKISVTCNSMLPAPADACYEIYMDNEPLPWVTVEASDTPGILPDTKSVNVDTPLTGIHTLYLKSCGYLSNVWSVAFHSSENGGIDEVISNPTSCTPIYYDLYGRRLQRKPASGIYIVRNSEGTRKCLGRTE